jgi:hypothetical protein
MDDFIQINRINTQAMPGPNFAPGVTKDGGGLVAPVGNWSAPVEEVFPAEPEPFGERPDYNYHPMEVNTAGNMWNQTREARPASKGWPTRWPMRRMQFDKGVTMVDQPSYQIKSSAGGTDIMLMVAGAVLIAFIIARRSN